MLRSIPAIAPSDAVPKNSMNSSAIKFVCMLDMPSHTAYVSVQVMTAHILLLAVFSLKPMPKPSATPIIKNTIVSDSNNSCKIGKYLMLLN